MTGHSEVAGTSSDQYRQTRVCLSIEFHLPGKCRSIPYDQKASRREVTAPQTLFNGTRPACNFRPTSLGFERSGNTEITVFPLSSVEVLDTPTSRTLGELTAGEEAVEDSVGRVGQFTAFSKS